MTSTEGLSTEVAWETVQEWADDAIGGRDPVWIHWALLRILGVDCPLPDDVRARIRSQAD